MPLFSFEEQVNDVRQRFAPSEGNYPKRHDKLLNLIKRLKNDGKDAIQNRLEDMQHADEIYRAYRVPDEDDKKAEERGEPIKIIYPVTYAQIQTTIAHMLSAVWKDPFYELEGRGPHFYRNSKLMELELQYQVSQGGLYIHLYQFLLDLLKYGFAKLNVRYEKQSSWITKKDPIKGFALRLIPQLAFLGLDPTTTEKILSYEGATFFCDDPTILNFDPNVSIGEIQKGQYVFEQRKISFNQLKKEAIEGDWFNVKDIPKAPITGRDDPTARPNATGTTVTGGAPPVEGGDIVVIDTCYVKLCPSDYELSELREQQIWEISMANNARIINAEPCHYQHGKFPTVIGEYSPDLHNTVNDGMAQTIDGLQTLVNWLLNSHMDAVRQTVDNHFVVDPDGIEISDIEKRRRFWRLKKGKGSQGVERFIKQLVTQDVTQMHVADADKVIQMIQRTVGESDMMGGRQLPGKRSASEVLAINQLGSARIKMLVSLLFEQALRPMGEQMISNTHQFMSADRYIKVSGSLAVQLGIPLQAVGPIMLKVSPEELMGQFSICLADTSSSQDKVRAAGAIKEMLGMVMQNPQLAMAVGCNIPQLLQQALVMNGVKNATDFIQPPPPDMMNLMIQAAIGKGGAPGGRPVQGQVMPDEMVQKEHDKGNLQPFAPKRAGESNG
jgi:hypothetical protein